MPAETARIMEVPPFLYRGFPNPGMSLGAHLIDNLGAGELAYELAPKSVPLAWKVALYTVGRDLAIGEPSANDLPDSVKAAGSLVYEDCQERRLCGVWHKDAVIFLPESEWPRGEIRPPGKSYVICLVDIEGFGRVNGVWRPKPSSNTIEKRLWVPRGDGNFIVPPAYGGPAYDCITGTPNETEPDKKKAIWLWMDAGLTKEQADKELSRFYRRDSGTAAVYSCSGGGSGPMCVSFDNEPDIGNDTLGSFAASRRPSGFGLCTNSMMVRHHPEARRRKIQAS